MPVVNVLYGYFVDGARGERHTTATRAALTKEIIELLNALVPPELDDTTKCGLAELYIRLCFTAADTAELLQQIDPINSYRLHSFYPNIDGNLSLDTIVQNLNNLSIPDTENTAFGVDRIQNALKYLLTLISQLP